MPYKNLISQPCADNKEVFQRLRDFLCARNGTYDYSTTGIGWTLHDAVYATDENTVAAGDFFVIHSTGEGGNEDLYFKVILAAGTIGIIGYLYWNSSTHQGVSAYGSSTNWTQTAATASTLWIYGDLCSVVGISKYGTTYYGNNFGMCPDSPYNQVSVTSALAITAGSNKVVTLSSVPADWAVGEAVIVKDNANVERVVITAISGLNVTFASFVNSYSSGCKFRQHLSYYAAYNASMSGSVWMLIAINGDVGYGYYSNLLVYIPSAVDGLIGGYPAVARYAVSSSYGGVLGPFSNMLITSNVLASESTHTDGVNSWRMFYISAGIYILLREI